MGQKANTGPNPQSVKSDGAKTYSDASSSSRSSLFDTDEKIQSRRDYIQHLQRTVGNHAVERLWKSGWLQKKLNIGPSKNRYELEADAVAEKVVSMDAPGADTDETVGNSPTNETRQISRKSVAESITPLQRTTEKPEEQLQEKEPEEEQLRGDSLQKSSTGSSDEDDEGQATLRQAQGRIQRSLDARKKELQRKGLIPLEIPGGSKLQTGVNQAYIQKKRAEQTPPKNPGDSKLQTGVNQAYIQKKRAEQTPPKNPGGSKLQTGVNQVYIQKRRAERTPPANNLNESGSAAPPGVESSINSAKGGGKPLSTGESSYYEPRFGSDFSGVRIHTGGQANDLSRSVNAKAFTVGSDIFFGSGQYNPDTSDGKKLMAHELTHTVQQGGGIKRKTENDVEDEELRKQAGTVEEVEEDRSDPDQNEQNSKNLSQRERDHEENERQYQNQNTIAAEMDDPVQTQEGRRGSTTDEPNTGESGTTGQVSAQDPAEAVLPETETGSEPQVNLNSDSSRGLLESISQVSPTSSVSAIGQVRSIAGTIQNREKADLQANLPAIERPTGVPRLGEAPVAPPTRLDRGEAPQMRQLSGRRNPPPEVGHNESRAPNPADRVSTRVSEPADDGGSWWSRMFGRVRSFVSSLPTTDRGVNTSAGERPRVDLSGDADPAQSRAQQAESNQEVGRQTTNADTATQTDFGENRIYPTEEQFPRETMRPNYQITPAETRSGIAIPQRGLSPSVRGRVDGSISGWYGEQMNEQLAQEQARREESDQQSTAARIEGDRRIDQETENARLEQTQLQQGAREEVSGRRQEWLSENRDIQETYDRQSTQRRQEIDGQIDRRVQSSEREAGDRMTTAENEAERERRNAERKAVDEKKRAENKPRSWWDSFKDAVSSAFDAIRSAVNLIFDGLRKLVKGIIEVAKRAVRGIIELARSAIVGLIKAFGEGLKALVSVALAAFPEAAARARSWIDARVEQTTNAVNAVADRLKQAADAILDFVGEALDFIISAYQAFYNLILDAVEFVGRLIGDAIERIGNLIESAQMMPDHFEGQMQEELLGMNLNKPLSFERTQMPESLEQTSTAQMPLSTQNTALLSRPVLTENDIEMDQVPTEEFTPEFLASLNLDTMQEGQEIEFGESNDAANSLDAIREELTSPVPEGVETGSPEAETDDASLVRQPGESHEAFTGRQLQHMMNNASPENACAKEQTEEAAQPGAIPESQKTIGPLTQNQRAGFMFHQMKKGISQWFECNWPWLLAAAIGVIAAVVALIIVTGGAILGALVPIMQVVGAIMVGVTLARVTSYVGDYLSNAWEGRNEAGAIALARGLAIGATELVFALLFSVAGPIFKVIRRGVTAAAKGARTVVRAATRVVARTARATGRAIARVGGTAIRNGRIMMRGLRRGFSRGARSLDDLGRRLGQRLRFKKFSIEYRRGWLWLYGHINPKVPIAKARLRRRSRRRLGRLSEVAGSKIRGFRNPGEIVERVGNLRNKLLKSGIDDVEIGIRGSSVTGVSGKGGSYRGVRGELKASDIDFFITSRTLEKRIMKIAPEAFVRFFLTNFRTNR